MKINETEFRKHIEELSSIAAKSEALCQILSDAAESNAVENAYMIFGLDVLHDETLKLCDKIEDLIMEYLIQPLC